MSNVETVKDVLANDGLLSKYMNGYKQRDGQITMAENIIDGYNTRKTVLINAPTGNGKSIGGLVPAILSKDTYGPTIVSTATKALQSQYMNKDLPLLHKAFESVGIEFKSHVLKGRENYVCTRRFQAYLSGSESEIQQTPEDIKMYKDVLLEWFSRTYYGDLEELDVAISPTLKHSICSNNEHCDPNCQCDCFYKLNKQLAQDADVLVVNHDLLALNFALHKNHGVSLLPYAYGLIIDEAHKFEDIMTKYLGFKLSEFALKNLQSSVISYMRKLEHYAGKSDVFKSQFKELDNITSEMYVLAEKFFKLFIPKDGKINVYRLHSNMIGSKIQSTGSKLISLLDDIGHRVPNPKSYGSKDKKLDQLYTSIDNRCRDIGDKIDSILNMSQYENETVFWVDISKTKVYLNSAPISVAKYTSDWLFTRSSDDVYNHEYEEGKFNKFEYGCVVLMSATLCVNKNFAFIKNRLGVNKYYSGTNDVCLTELIIPEVFDYKHQCLLYVPKGIIEPPTSNRDKQVFTRQICQTLTTMSKVVDGGILALFTSYMEMNKVYDMTSKEIDNRMTISQIMFNKSKLIQMFNDNRDSLLYATSSFWEGIDIQGDSLSCVIIDRLPFPVPSEPIIEARIEYIKRNGGDWFNSYYLSMMIIALQQGFGRLIRTNKDLGIVVLMDNRLLSKPYGRKILNSLPQCLKTRKLDKVEVFFDIVRRKRSIRGTRACQ